MTTAPDPSIPTTPEPEPVPAVGVPHLVADEHAAAGVVAVPVIPAPETPDHDGLGPCSHGYLTTPHPADPAWSPAAAGLFPRRPEPVVAAAIRAAQARYGLTTSLEALDRIAEDWLGIHGTGA